MNAPSSTKLAKRAVAPPVDDSAGVRALRRYLDYIADRTPGRETDPDDDPTLKLGPIPYPGLRYFDHDTSALLIARETASARIRERFAAQQIVVVIGGSGSGKSSLVRGRVLTEIATQGYPVAGRPGGWYPVAFRPVTEPVAQMVDALWNGLFSQFLEQRETNPALDETIAGMFGQVTDTDAMRAHLRAQIEHSARDPADGHEGMETARLWLDTLDYAMLEGERAGGANLLLLVDQFEEIFRGKVDQAEARTLFDMIRYVYRHKPRGVFLVLTMRAEDLHRCAQVPGLPDLVNDSMYLVDWLDASALADAVVQPARRVLRDWGIPLADHPTAPYASEVVDALTAAAFELQSRLDHKSDHLPLFQHALRALWRHTTADWRRRLDNGETRGFSIELQHLDQVVRQARPGPGCNWMQAALNAHADQVFDKTRCAFRDVLDAPGVKPVDTTLAIRAALCSVASLDENKRYHREFVRVEEVVRLRFPRLREDPRTRDALTRALSAALDHFVEHGLLVGNQRDGVTSYDVAHEALIRNWKRLDDWVQREDALVSAVLACESGSISAGRADDEPPRPRVPISSDHLITLNGVFGGWLSDCWLSLRMGTRIRLMRACRAIHTSEWLVDAVANRRRQTGNDDAVAHARELTSTVRTAWHRKMSRRLAQSTLVFATACALVGMFTLFFDERLRADDQTRRTHLLESYMIGSNAEHEKFASPFVLYELRAAYSLLADNDHGGRMREALLAHRALGHELRTVLGETIHVSGRPPAAGRAGVCTGATEIGATLRGRLAEVRLVDMKSRGGRDGAVGFEVLPPAAEGAVSSTPRTASDRFIRGGEVTVDRKPGYEICLSPSGEILTVTQPGLWYPQVYRLSTTWLRGARAEPSQVLGIELSELRRPAMFTEPDEEVFRGTAQVTGFGFDPQSWRRSVFFEVRLADQRTASHEAFFYDGMAVPVREHPDTSEPRRIPSSDNWESARWTDNGADSRQVHQSEGASLRQLSSGATSVRVSRTLRSEGPKQWNAFSYVYEVTLETTDQTGPFEERVTRFHAGNVTYIAAERTVDGHLLLMTRDDAGTEQAIKLLARPEGIENLVHHLMERDYPKARDAIAKLREDNTWEGFTDRCKQYECATRVAEGPHIQQPRKLAGQTRQTANYR